jgi:hypothetical protein
VEQHIAAERARANIAERALAAESARAANPGAALTTRPALRPNEPQYP